MAGRERLEIGRGVYRRELLRQQEHERLRKNWIAIESVDVVHRVAADDEVEVAAQQTLGLVVREPRTERQPLSLRQQRPDQAGTNGGRNRIDDADAQLVDLGRAGL